MNIVNLTGTEINVSAIDDTRLVCTNAEPAVITLPSGTARTNGTSLQILKFGNGLEICLVSNDKLQDRYVAAKINDQSSVNGAITLQSCPTGWMVIGEATGEWELPGPLFPDNVWTDGEIWKDFYYWEE